MSAPYEEHDGYKWPSEPYPDATVRCLLQNGLCDALKCDELECEDCAYQNNPEKDGLKVQLAVIFIATLHLLEAKENEALKGHCLLVS